MRFLASRRHHRLAKPLVVVFALLLMGAVYYLATPGSTVMADNGTSQVDKGKELFAVSCSSCHGLNGEGTSEGPSLVGVGAASVDFQMGTGRMPMAKPGPQAPRAPVSFSDEDIAAIGAFVQSLAPGPEVPSPDQYEPEGLSAEEIARGGEIFRTNCSACHNFEGGGGALPWGKHAPDLRQVENRHIYEAVRIGPQQMPVFSKQTLTDQDVREVIGYLKTLQDNPKGGLTLGGQGPVGEGLWAWVAGLGGLCIIATWIASRGSRK